VKIFITEVGPRDGLQNESAHISTEAKVEFINALSQTGLHEIEVSSFVSPKWIPQLADAKEVFEQIERNPDVMYSALVPNERGLERALEVNVDKIAVFTAASETFNKKNTNASIAESIELFRPVVETAKAENLPIRGYVSTAFYCPFEGKIAPDQVIPVIEQLLELGVDEISLGDTIGKAVPNDIRALLGKVLRVVEKERVVLHLHNTYGTAIANALVAYEEFHIARFDSSAGGLGGCPYAPGATGNVATEDLGYALGASEAEVAFDLQKVLEAARGIQPHLGHGLESSMDRVL